MNYALVRYGLWGNSIKTLLKIQLHLLVSREQVARIDLVGNAPKLVFEAVGDDDIAALRELREVVYDLKAIKVATVGECWFVDDNLYAFAAEILNDILDSG